MKQSLIKWSSALVLTLASCTLAFANSSKCIIKNTAFSNGEKLKFSVFYNLSAVWVQAGEANFSTAITSMYSKPAYHITGVGKTLPSYDWIFKVRDTYQTYIDTASLMPLRFLRDVNEGGYKFKNDVVFYQDIKKAISGGKSFSTPVCVQDVLSSIYYARNIDYDKYQNGDKIPLNLFLDDEVYEMYIHYKGKHKIKTKYGHFNAIKLQVLLIEGTIFKGGEKMVIWVSDDKNHIPLRVESPILVGSVKVDMMKYENLRYPLSSLIKKL